MQYSKTNVPFYVSLSCSTPRSHPMSSQAGASDADPWSEIVGSDQQPQEQQPRIAVIYGRRNANNEDKPEAVPEHNPSLGNRPSFAPIKRNSWNRFLSTRGRTSIANDANFNSKPRQKPKGKAKLAIPKPKGKSVKLPNYEKEQAYFEEIDSFELLEENPSPMNFTWTMGIKSDHTTLPPLSSVLRRLLSRKNSAYSSGASKSLSKIFETPGRLEETTFLYSKNMKTPLEVSQPYQQGGVHFLSNKSDRSFMIGDALERHMSLEKNNTESLAPGDVYIEDAEGGIKKLSLASQRASFYGCYGEPFCALLEVCGQQSPSTLSNVLLNYCTPDSLAKVGEGTYGEAFKVGETVCKIVPIDGNLRVNGEVQKRSEEVLEEAVLCRTLNLLRRNGDQAQNSCNYFIKTVNLMVCQGNYDARLIRAWEDWDVDHGSENDHPRTFSGNQRYIVFVLEHGGRDLENFVLLDFNEAKSLLVQVTAALAVAESAYEFEHRDLHWGNILLSRRDSKTSQFTLEGKCLSVNTFGLSVSIIDFTLSRINTGEDILYLDLSLDMELFEGPRGDKQAETYRKMREITEDCWEESFPKTNILWLQYLVDILLLKKSFNQTSKDERDLRSLKKRLHSYESSKEAIRDPFFENLFITAMD